MSMNLWVLIGRMTKDPELSYTPSGKAVCKFTLAVDRNTKRDADGNTECDFIPCVAWEKSAEFLGNYGAKGRLAAVEGRLSQRSWATQDGQKRTAFEVIANRVQLLDRPKDQGADARPNLDVDDPFDQQ